MAGKVFISYRRAGLTARDTPADLFEYLHNVRAAEVEPSSIAGEKRENVSMIVSTRSLRPVTS
jgi:hypothetical protein